MNIKIVLQVMEVPQMRADYYTVKEYGESELIIQKSRFLTYV